MTKKLFFVSVLALAAIVMTTNLSAHEPVDPGDSVWADFVVVNNDVDEIGEVDDVDEVYEIVDSAYTDVEGIEVDNVLMAERLVGGNVMDVGDNQNAKKGENGWLIHSLYFMDRNSWKMRAKFRKELNEPIWYYYEPVYVDDYEMLSDAAQPLLMLNTFESDNVTKAFSFHEDSIRIYHYGDYPKDTPKYSLLVVTIKERNSK